MSFFRPVLALLSLVLLWNCPAFAGSGLPLRIVYFVPADRSPCPGYAERLDRVMTEVQRFYRDGMATAGHGSMTFGLERDTGGRLQIYPVHGKHPMRDYGRNDSEKAREEVKTALRKKGIDIDRETIVIFQVLLAWNDGKATEIGPYCGGGDYRAGTAWVFDDDRLDSRLLNSKEPGGYYGGPCSIGEFNSHYVGGVAHELGHALGLPHDREREADRTRGTSLMGGGNHTYGQELRHEGMGTFLSPASAMPLASCRTFAGRREDAARSPTCTVGDFDAAYQQGKIILNGVLRADPPAYGIVAYNDDESIPDDYDAVGWVCNVGKDGRFRLEIGELHPGKYQLRLRVCHADGSSSVLAYHYAVNRHGRPDLSGIRSAFLLDEALRAYKNGDKQRIETLAAEAKRQFPDLTQIHRKISHLAALLTPPPLWNLQDVPAEQKIIPVSRLKFRAESVGWGRPLRDQVWSEPPGDCLIQVDGRFYESGLFAHAPSLYVLELNGTAKRFRSGYGLQDRHDGSVVFVVSADGRELFSSRLIKDHTRRSLDIDVRGVKRLELSVEDGGDGAANDWGVWIEPYLER